MSTICILNINFPKQQFPSKISSYRRGSCPFSSKSQEKGYKRHQSFRAKIHKKSLSGTHFNNNNKKGSGEP